MANGDLIVDENVLKENRFKYNILFISNFFNLYLNSEVGKTSNEKYIKSHNIAAFIRVYFCHPWKDCIL